MGDRYWIESSRIVGRWVVMEDVGYAEVSLFAGSHDDCVSFIRDLEQSEESEG